MFKGWPSDLAALLRHIIVESHLKNIKIYRNEGTSFPIYDSWMYQIDIDD